MQSVLLKSECESAESQNNYKIKSEVVKSLLARWWYAMPEWPPRNYDYSNELKFSNLYCCNEEQWDEMPDVNGEGKTKCLQLFAYPGVFCDIYGTTHDLRPETGKPSFNALMKNDYETLRCMLSTALNRQLEALSNSCYANTEQNIISKIENKLRSIKLEFGLQSYDTLN